MEFRTTSVFAKTLKAYNDGAGLIIEQGGTRSSKTVSILQLLYLIALYSKKPLVISVVSRALPHLKLGAIRDFDTIVLPAAGVVPDKIKNKTELSYKVGVSLIEFFGVDQVDKVHGPSRDILFVNEANFIKYDIYDQLAIRTKGCIFIDYNPTQRFWVHETVIPEQKHIFIKSTYLDNEELPQSIKDRIEAKKKNINWWRVYGEGEIGINEGAIFTNWLYGDFPRDLVPTFGLDYGFYPDPDAFVKVAILKKEKRIYAHECIYENYNGTEELRKKMLEYATSQSLIVAESASPRTNYDLQRTFKNLKKVKKTRTVVDWIREMQDYQIIVTEDSYNLGQELANYIWSDKKAGVPLDSYNHLIDAMRYVYMNSNRGLRFNF